MWNSARCDTANNAAGLFPRAAGAIINNAWSGTYHEIELGIGGGDAYSATTVTRLGVGTKRHKCFLATNTALPNDIDCEHDPDGISTPATGVFPGVYDLTWVLATGSGYGPDANGPHPYSREFTIQGTKMIPDGLLTPGAHVEYFWRKAENGSTAMTGMLPDTNIVRPQLAERNVEGHRFAGFGALPDRWKQGGYNHPLFGLFANSVQPACLLAVNDQTTNSNDWVGWVSVTDTIGATSSLKWGAEVGWHAKGGGADINVPANNIDRAGRLGFIAEHGGNPGTTWDGYQIIGAEDTAPAGSFGQRYAKSDASNTQINDKRGLQAPTLEQLKAFYKIIFFMTGNLNALAVGPQGNRGSDDQQLIKDYLLSGSPATLNRVFWANGDGFVEGMAKETDLTKQPDLLLNYLGAGLQSNEYRTDSGDAKTTIDLRPSLTSSINSGEIYGVRNTCNHTNDVLKVAIGAVQTLSSPFTYYGTTTSFAASILKTYSAAKPWAALTEGYSIIDLMNRFGSDTRGRSKYFLEVLTKQFGGVCPVVGTPVVNLDVPNLSEGNAFADFVNLRNNPLSSGKSTIKFGLAQADRVEIKVYDVTGREVRELANRQFVAGEHTAVWDGSDNTGRPVARGVYFTQVRYKDSGFSDAKKLTVLK